MIPYSFLADSLGFSSTHSAEQTVTLPSSLFVFLIENYLLHQPFNEENYLHTNPDVADAIQAGTLKSGKQHYVTQGYWEERDGAGPSFSEEWYVRQNPDVAIAVQRGECPSGAVHYGRYGRQEGRCPNPEQADLYAAWRSLYSRKPRLVA
nr:hypothetical protein [uncultured Acetobacter sp.]